MSRWYNPKKINPDGARRKSKMANKNNNQPSQKTSKVTPNTKILKLFPFRVLLLPLNTTIPNQVYYLICSTMPADDVEIDIELRSVQLKFPNGRGSISESCDQRRIPTDKGEVLVAIQGDTSKPAIITYHDLGLNCRFHYNNVHRMSL